MPALFDSRSRVLQLAFVAMGVGVVFHAAHALTGLGHPALDSFVTNWLYSAIEVLAVAVCAARALTRPDDRVAWWFLVAGLVFWTAGDLVWSVWLNNVADPPYPSLADAFYLAMYPCLYVGLVLLMRTHHRQVGGSVWLDGLVVGLTMASIGAYLVFPALHEAGHGSTAAVTVNLVYLMCDFMLLVFIAVAFALFGWRPGRMWSLLAVGTVVLAAADMVFLYQEAKGTYVAGRILDTMWPASMVIFALAAWQPQPVAKRRPVTGRHTILLPVCFGVLALGLLSSEVVTSSSRLWGLLASAALLAVGARTALTYTENLRMLRRHTHDAITDALTGLGNRRRLMDDLDVAVQRGPGQPQHSTLVFFDLDGFKTYNDSFGHGAGDALLMRLGRALVAAIEPHGRAYRLGGDEFCVLVRGRRSRRDELVVRAQQALGEQGSGFTVTASCGVVVVPDEADSVTMALSLADERMYADKGEGGRIAHSQTQSVLMQLLTEREPVAHDHVCDVGALAVAVGRRFALDSEQLDELRRAAELHDIGKLAIPDLILEKPEPLSQGEWRLIRQHTIVGERILGAAPALRLVARLVRSSHERWDGAGYPDGLAGVSIPLGARIIAACDSYDAMVSDRPYQEARTAEEAIAELRRHAGSQFDPDVIQALCEHLEAQRAIAIATQLVQSPSSK